MGLAGALVELMGFEYGWIVCRLFSPPMGGTSAASPSMEGL